MVLSEQKPVIAIDRASIHQVNSPLSAQQELPPSASVCASIVVQAIALLSGGTFHPDALYVDLYLKSVDGTTISWLVCCQSYLDLCSPQILY